MTTEGMSTAPTEVLIQPVQGIILLKIGNCNQDTAPQPQERACLKSVAATNAKYLTLFAMARWYV